MRTSKNASASIFQMMQPLCESSNTCEKVKRSDGFLFIMEGCWLEKENTVCAVYCVDEILITESWEPGTSGESSTSHKKEQVSRENVA